MAGGRPLKFKTVKELEDKIKEYYNSCWRNKRDMFGNIIKDKETGEKVLEQYKPYTITGLAVYLGTTRETLMDYEANEKYSDTIKAAKEVCHAYAEESLFVGKNPSGAIFNLKNNYGWVDKMEQEVKSTNTNYNHEINDMKDKFLTNATAAEKQKYTEGNMTDKEINEIISRK